MHESAKRSDLKHVYHKKFFSNTYSLGIFCRATKKYIGLSFFSMYYGDQCYAGQRDP